MIWRPSPHWSSRHGTQIDMVIIHGDRGRSDEGTLSWLEDPQSKVSYHYLVGRDGETYKIVDEENKAWHAGVSSWRGRNDVNPRSIGVAFANYGPEWKDGLPEPFRPVQYDRGAWLVADICERHRIPLGNIRGHFEVSPGRKSDPWSHFDWEVFGVLLGRYAWGRGVGAGP